MCNYFAEVILVLDSHYREHLRNEQQKESDRETRSAKRKANRSAGRAKISGLQKRRQHKGT